MRLRARRAQRQHFGMRLARTHMPTLADDPAFAHSRDETIGGVQYKIVNDGEHIHVVGWVSHKVLYWLNNTLLEELSNAQMLTIAKSAHSL